MTFFVIGARTLRFKSEKQKKTIKGITTEENLNYLFNVDCKELILI